MVSSSDHCGTPRQQVILLLPDSGSDGGVCLQQQLGWNCPSYHCEHPVSRCPNLEHVCTHSDSWSPSCCCKHTLLSLPKFQPPLWKSSQLLVWLPTCCSSSLINTTGAHLQVAPRDCYNLNMPVNIDLKLNHYHWWECVLPLLLPPPLHMRGRDLKFTFSDRNSRVSCFLQLAFYSPANCWGEGELNHVSIMSMNLNTFFIQNVISTLN